MFRGRPRKEMKVIEEEKPIREEIKELIKQEQKQEEKQKVKEAVIISAELLDNGMIQTTILSNYSIGEIGEKFIED